MCKIKRYESESKEGLLPVIDFEQLSKTPPDLSTYREFKRAQWVKKALKKPSVSNDDLEKQRCAKIPEMQTWVETILKKAANQLVEKEKQHCQLVSLSRGVTTVQKFIFPRTIDVEIWNETFGKQYLDLEWYLLKVPNTGISYVSEYMATVSLFKAGIVIQSRKRKSA